MLNERGVRAEALPLAEDVKKIQRKLGGDEKKILKEVNKNKENVEYFPIQNSTRK